VHLPLYIFNCTSESIGNEIVVANPPPQAILFILSWSTKTPTLPAGFVYKNHLVITSNDDTNVVAHLASTNHHTAAQLQVKIYFLKIT